jgi:hypothetical protein
MKKWIAIVTAVILIGFGSTAYTFDDTPKTENQQEAVVVKNSNGDDVGIVTDALVDRSGNIAFIILGIGTETGGKKEIAVPSGVFLIDRQNKILLLDVRQEDLARAPEFDVSNLSDSTFAERVYRFFGLVPSWAGEPGEGENEY